MSILPEHAIVIPAKNEEKYLPNLLASLSHQLYLQCVPTRIYLADARSTDGTVESAFAFRGVLDIEVGLSPDAPHLSTALCPFERSCANLQPPASEDRLPWHDQLFLRTAVRSGMEEHYRKEGHQLQGRRCDAIRTDFARGQAHNQEESLML